MTPEKQNAISLFCYTTVSSMFASFHNPKMRGSAFTWDKFPDMMEKHCRAMYPFRCRTEVNDNGEFADQEEFDHAAITGRQIAEYLVGLMSE